MNSDTGAADHRREWLALLSLMIGFFGCLVFALWINGWVWRWSDSAIHGWLIGYGLIALVGIASVVPLGRRGLVGSLGSKPNRNAFVFTAAGTALSLALIAAYLYALNVVAPDWNTVYGFVMPTDWGWLGLVVLPALTEEWLLRGVLWEACRRVFTSRISTIVVTATAFAVLHGIEGGMHAWLPCHFIAGLILGAVRWRTGSLVPCIVTHLLVNGLVCFVA